MDDEYRVSMTGITKAFSGAQALKGVDFFLRPGEIHALVGENGAGKSTLVKILSGAYTADSGEIRIDGRAVSIGSPRRGKELGVGIVYQEFELAEELTIAENIFLDRLGKHGFIRWKPLYERARRVMDSLGFDVDVTRPVKELSVAYKQMVEIAKALSADAKILVLDEPTAVLSPTETRELFETIFRLKAAGVSIIYISHRMDEIFAVCDAITMMRDGEVTGSGMLKDFSEDDVVERMIGRKLSTMYPPRDCAIGGELLRAEGLCGGAFTDISFTLHMGEILGIFGLVGSGRTEIARAVFGADQLKAGRVYWKGKPVRIRSPHQATRRGIALIPESRKDQGLVQAESISTNITMCSIRRITSPRGVLRRRRERALVSQLVEKLAIKTGDFSDAVSSLSGGNQQKVVIAKWLATDSQALIMDEPTRGVDVGAKVEIYRIMNDLAAHGSGILMISSELNEIIGMCDRVMVVDSGRRAGELARGDISEKNIMRLVVGGSVQ